MGLIMQLAFNDHQHGSAGASDDALQVRPQPVVYAISMVGVDNAPIKFGCVRRRGVTDRLREMQIASPFDLEMLAHCNSDPRAERTIHWYLVCHLIRGEWYRRNATTLKVVEAIKAGDSELMALIEHMRQPIHTVPKRPRPINGCGVQKGTALYSKIEEYERLGLLPPRPQREPYRYNPLM
jgi:hypothetical protein